MHFRTNFMALVGGGINPKWPKNQVKLWDDHTQRVIETLSYTGDVVAVRFRNDKLVVVLINKVYVYNFADMTLIDCLETSKNEEGLCALNPETTTGVVAIPDKDEGAVRVRRYCQNVASGQGVDLIYPAAHKTPVMTLALSRNGEYLATAGQCGTKIKIWSTKTEEGEEQKQNAAPLVPIYTVRRGLDRAVIKELVFSKTSKFIGLSSDHAKLHVWKLPMGQDGMFDPNLIDSTNEGSSENSSLMLKIFSKFSKLPLSYARWTIDNEGQKKFLAFSEDET